MYAIPCSTAVWPVSHAGVLVVAARLSVMGELEFMWGQVYPG
jgi:hypothetical protein